MSGRCHNTVIGFRLAGQRDITGGGDAGTIFDRRLAFVGRG